jgi:predicted dehydrogenase
MPDNASPTHRPLGIGIIGCGHIAGAYAEDIAASPEVTLVAATDLDPARAAAFVEKHGGRAHASIGDLLADESVELVVNLTVHHVHFDVTSQALEAGRHVYSEKPMALESGEARQLVELAARKGSVSAAPR